MFQGKSNRFRGGLEKLKFVEFVELSTGDFEWAHTYQFFVLLAEIVAITSLSNSCSPKYLLLSR